MDHLEARIFRIHPEESEDAAPIGPLHLIRHKRSTGPGALHERFFHDVGESLEDMQRVVLAGAVEPKRAFLEYLQQNAGPLMDRVVSMETPAHPTDGQLVACARTLFQRNASLPALPSTRLRKPKSVVGATLRAFDSE
jgi:hypothetical protein